MYQNSLYFRKDHINRELLAQKHWPEKWGFLSDIYKDVGNFFWCSYRENTASFYTFSLYNRCLVVFMRFSKGNKFSFLIFYFGCGIVFEGLKTIQT